MNIDDVERLIGLFERSRLMELDYAQGATRVRMSRQGSTTPGQETAPAPPSSPPSVEMRRTAPVEPPAASPHILCSGMLGTFYRSPGPGQAPFVTEGDVVEDGQTLGILEAMKTLNPVESDRAGRIVRILVEDGVSIAAGTPLFALVD